MVRLPVFPTTINELRLLNPIPFRDIDLIQEEILRMLSIAEAGWMHNGDPKMPHAELASGYCSNGFFYCQKLLRFPNITEILAHQLCRKICRDLGNTLNNIDAVVGSPYSSIALSYEVAKFIGAVHGIPQKDPNDPKGKKMVWKEEFPAGTRILRIEELITTVGSTNETTVAIQTSNPNPVSFLPIVGALVYRPPKLTVDYWNMRIIALVEKEIWAVPQTQCNLCRQGSIRVKPKANWSLLAGK